ncbi:ImmA/IrrE family metallo-endopeptidase [Georgenia faecalis]|uniref:ImmA/IrrE family metallo-endopeptidase n=1 Tax=Georgenia faecalis TaxID=2483799 RepID=UPI000FD9617B|nr:ImmA/IrrE family metallo-endopeptidase [Georgenia faecalis]
MWHPWRILRALPHVIVHWTPTLPGDVRGITDGRAIWLDDTQLQTERRSTLTHELEHITRGHRGCVSGAEERDVREAAARRLIPMTALLDVLRWAGHLEEAAEELWVDVDTLEARLEALTDDERRQLERLIADREDTP